MAGTKQDAVASFLETCQVPGKPLYIVGSFDRGVTVLSQQRRALNLVWALVESRGIPTLRPGAASESRTKIAIVGGGFAGLSVAAALLQKRAAAAITIFEERDALLPLQQGCDSRWLHPGIYNWPAEGSTAIAAMLPVLNWTAARASDVVVQVLSEWKHVLANRDNTPTPTLYCNTRHLQVYVSPDDPAKLRIEWIGERREVEDATIPSDPEDAAVGANADFDIVIMAVGFGLETHDDTLSYWRNEMIGQPSLDQPRRIYLVAGQGDGAMIDLLRLRISQFRQDRILDDLFGDKLALLGGIKRIYDRRLDNGLDLFKAFEALADDQALSDQFHEVRKRLAQRLRRDTEVILHLKVKRFGELFEAEKASKSSFQNKLLMYFLYKCGGFVPSKLDESDLIKQHKIPRDQVIRRYGTHPERQLGLTLSEELFQLIDGRRGTGDFAPFHQSDKLLWTGGYFDFPGTEEDAESLGDELKERWRKEYLPSPTAILATGFCASIAAALKFAHPQPGRLRVTLHRTISVGEEPLLQQTCDYEGTEDAKWPVSAAARTFPADNATIGQAYRTQRIVRSVRNVSPDDLQEAMKFLNLNVASTSMAKGVSFVLAIPILQPAAPQRFIRPSPVTGVLYVDSKSPNFFIDDHELGALVSMTQQLLEGVISMFERDRLRFQNVPLAGLGAAAPAVHGLPGEVLRALELVDVPFLPRTTEPFQFNIDHSDFVRDL